MKRRERMAQITPLMRQYLRDLRLGMDPRRNVLDFVDVGHLQRRELGLKKRGLLNAAGELTPAGLEASK